MRKLQDQLLEQQGFRLGWSVDQRRQFRGVAAAALGAAPFLGAVYAHSSSTLYEVDPTTLKVTKVGDFRFPSRSESQPPTGRARVAAMMKPAARALASPFE